jgi:putative ubiquitin-RnfH superfamily antitoxin RatB of RatAB toxin-antitoxin module
MGNQIIQIEVAYATAIQQQIIELEACAGTTVEQAIIQSNISKTCPEINLLTNKVGIFSQIVNLTQVLQTGDRIEIYRPLQIDPRVARSERVRRSTK